MSKIPNPMDVPLGEYLHAVLGGHRYPGAGVEFLKKFKMKDGDTLADRLTPEDFEHIRIELESPVDVRALYQHAVDYYTKSEHEISPPEWGKGGFTFTASIVGKTIHITGYMQTPVFVNISAMVDKKY